MQIHPWPLLVSPLHFLLFLLLHSYLAPFLSFPLESFVFVFVPLSSFLFLGLHHTHMPSVVSGAWTGRPSGHPIWWMKEERKWWEEWDSEIWIVRIFPLFISRWHWIPIVIQKSTLTATFILSGRRHMTRCVRVGPQSAGDNRTCPLPKAVLRQTMTRRRIQKGPMGVGMRVPVRETAKMEEEILIWWRPNNSYWWLQQIIRSQSLQICCVIKAYARETNTDHDGGTVGIAVPIIHFENIPPKRKNPTFEWEHWEDLW